MWSMVIESVHVFLIFRVILTQIINFNTYQDYPNDLLQV